MKVITFLNEKGGVGKTTMAGTIGAGLAIMGYRVLLMDADPQGHLTLSFGIPKAHGMYDLLVRDADFNDPGVIVPVDADRFLPPNIKTEPKGRLYVVPGNRETRLISQALENEFFAIREKLADLQQRNVVDVVIIDTSPTPSPFHAHIYLATHHILYPTEVTYLSFDGLVTSVKATTGFSKQKQQSGLEDIKLTGIIPTKFRAKTLEHREKLQQLKQGFGKMVWTPLPMSVVWEEAMARQISVFRYAYDHPVAGEAWKVVKLAKERAIDVEAT
jgi:chromosome partitioning protein